MSTARIVFRPEMLVKNETPLGETNGLNSLFQTANPFRPETLEVFLDGKRLTPIADFTVTSEDEFEIVVGPGRKRLSQLPCNEEVSVNYIKLC